jgi:hypothetical protein
MLAGGEMKAAALRLSVGASALLALLACERRAPGPRECETFALHVVGVVDERALGRPDVKAAVDAWTARCLTTPYDRELLACVSRGEVGCYRAFAARHPERAQRDARRHAQ